MLHGFAFTMVVGIITGTYSSVFIAAAIVSFWRGSGADARPPRTRRRPPPPAPQQPQRPVEAAAQGAGVVSRFARPS